MKIATEYINIPLENVGLSIQSSLQEIGQFVDADRAYVFDYNMENRTSTNLFEYCKEGIEPEIQNLQQIPFDVIPDWCNAHFKGEVIYIPDVGALPEGNLRDILAPQGILSLITLPMMEGNVCLGFVGFDAVQHYRSYNEEELRLLLLFAQMPVNLQLRSRQEKRSQELTKKIETALKTETELNLIKTRFITMTSHQFRTPLTSIQASAELIAFNIGNLDIPVRGRLEKNINRIIQEVDRLTALMNDVRFLGAAGADRVPYQPVETNLGTLMSEIIENQEPPFGDPRKASLSISGEPRLIQLDPPLFHQLICNLLSNALKYSAGKPAPSVELRYNPEEIRITITDHGIGIPKNDIPRLFETFYRASNVDNINGTGLGLSISKHIAQLHGGEILIKSEELAGTVVTLVLPLKAAQ